MTVGGGPASAALGATLAQRLALRGQQGLLRQRLVRHGPQQPTVVLNGHPLVSFCSNDYLGLASHPAVLAACREGLEQYGLGSGASHLVTGHSAAHHALEEELADFLGRDRALLFSTGYMANVGVINALMQEGDLVLQDALNHASLLDGGWLSRAQSRRYAHGDPAAVQAMLDASTAAQHLLVTDGVFSMDGDLAPLPALIAIARQRGAWLMVDDAHGIGCIGHSGRGIIECAGPGGRMATQDDVPILIGTLGKAFGTSGAFVAGEAALIEYLVQTARPYIYSTAMPAAIAHATRRSLRLVQEEPWRRQRLQELSSRFRAHATGLNLQLTDSASPVQAVILGDVARAMQASRILWEEGLQVSAIRPPTVPAGTARLRITFCATHTDAQLARLLRALDRISHDVQ